MNDLEILDTIAAELKNVDHPRFAQNMIDFYEQLVSQVPEDGFEQILEDSAISIEEEGAILQLQKYGYLERIMRGIGRGQVEHHIDLRGPRFFEIANGQSKPVVIGMTDSGKRETFSTGAVRDSAEGKPRPDLFSPFAMERIGAWLELGSRKYEPRNWEKGMEFSRVASSLHRHLMKFMQHDQTEDHLAAICVNASFLMHYEAMIRRGVLPESLDDMPGYGVIPSCHNNGDEALDY